MLIHHYLRKQLLTICFGFTIIPILIVWLTQARPIIEMVIDNGISLVIFLKLSLLVLPSLLLHILPFTFALSIVYLLYKLNQDNEMSILWASGVEPIKLTHIFFKYSLCCGLFIFLLNGYIHPRSEQIAKKEIFLIKNDLAKNLLKSSSFLSPGKDIKIYIQSIKGGTQIEGFFLSDKTDPEIEKIFTAEKAALVNDEKGDNLLLLGGQILMLPTNSSKKSALLTFDNFTFNIDSFNQASKILPKTKNDDLTILQLFRKINSSEETQKLSSIKQILIYVSTIFEPIIYAFIVLIGLLYPLSPRNFPIYRIFSVLSCIIVTKLFLSFLQDSHLEKMNDMYFLFTAQILLMLAPYFYIKKYTK